MLTLAHQIPGRLRLVGPAIKKDPDQAVALARRACNLPGVTGVRVGAATGSLVVFHHDAPHIRDTILQSLGVTTSAPAGPSPRILNALSEAVVEKLLGFAAQAVLAAVL